MRTVPLSILAFAGCASVALAQGLDLGGSGPVEITAQQGIEWRRDDRVVIARGQARASREGVLLEADRLLARYRDQPGRDQPAPAPRPGADDGQVGGGEIYRLEAEGTVRITSATDEARGERAVYDVDEAVLVLTGNRPRYAVGKDWVAADASLEYWRDKRMAVARGRAEAQSDGRTIRADILTATFSDTNAPAAPRSPQARPVPGEGRITRIEAFDNVEITTATETVRGSRAVYTPESGIARLVGNVSILRGPNQLRGGQAEVNLRTGISRLLPGGDGRVQGQILPERPPAQTPGTTQPVPTRP